MTYFTKTRLAKAKLYVIASPSKAGEGFGSKIQKALAGGGGAGAGSQVIQARSINALCDLRARDRGENQMEASVTMNLRLQFVNSRNSILGHPALKPLAASCKIDFIKMIMAC